MDQTKNGVAVIYYCPDDEPAQVAPSVIKYRYTGQTEFFDLLREASFFFGKNIQKVVLKDSQGSQWPLNRPVWKELAQSNRDIRLCPVMDLEEEDEAKATEVEAAEEVIEEEHKLPIARPPLWSELVIHLVFLTVIILHSVLGNTEETIYNFNTAMNNAFFDKQYDKTWQTASGANAQSQLMSNFGAFTSQSVIDVADTRTSLEPRDLFEVRDMADICGWVQGNLARGIFHTGVNQNDATGALMTFNRIIGGVRFEVTTQPWMTDQQAYSLHWPYFFWWFGGRPPTSTTVSYLRPAANWTQGFLAGQQLLFEDDLQAITGDWCPTEGNGTGSTIDHGTQVMREMVIQILAYNHNVDMYAVLNFKFVLDYGGKYLTTARFMFQRYTNEVSMIVYNVGWLHLLRNFNFWLTLINYALVLTRSTNEFRAARTIKRKGRPLFWDYFGGIFTQLELFNLCCNYVGIGIRIYSSLSAGGRLFLTEVLPAANNSDVSEMVSVVERSAYLGTTVRVVRAFSVMSGCLLLFKYLELFPRARFASFYLTGSALSRAGRNLKFVFTFFLLFLGAFAIAFEHVFGAQLEEFSSIWHAFFTLIVCVSGFGGVYWDLARVEPVLGPLFFIAFQLCVLIFIIPFFLAIINDAYAMRAAALDSLKEKVRKALEDKKRAESSHASSKKKW